MTNTKSTIADKIIKFIDTHQYQDIELSNTTFHYLLCGSGSKTLVFLDGGMGTSEAWFEYINYFENDYQILTFSFPHNLNTNSDQVSAIGELMNKLEIDQATFIGVSYGALLAQLFTKKFPNYVDRLVLLSSGGLTSVTKDDLKKYKLMFKFMVFSAKIIPFKVVKKNIIRDSIKNLTNENETSEKKALVAEAVYQLYHNCSKQTVMNMGYLLIDIFNSENCTKDDFTFLADKVMLILPEKDFFPRKSQQSLVDLTTNPKLIWIKEGAHGDPMFSEEYMSKIEVFLNNHIS